MLLLRRARTALVLAWIVALTAPTMAAAQDGPLADLDDYIERERQDWLVPGLAVAVVKDGQVVYADGFGVRDLRTGEPVDENTIFAIGSASKAFTVAGIGELVDRGQLSWDDPVTDYLPGFQVHDPYVTRELTIRDLLTHRSGLRRGDMVWFATELSRQEILDRVRFQEPTSSFRSEFGYNNNMFLAAGEVIRAVTGQTWDEFVDAEFFTPLGMERSTTSTLELDAQDNVAQPHAEIDDEVRPIGWRNIDNIGPAGSINSSVLEMANWVKLQLGDGDFGDTELLSEGVVAEMHSPQTIIPQEGPWALMAPEANFLTYGMGWFLNDYRGRKVVHHGGSIDGMQALVGMMPAEEIGVVVLSNLLPNYLTFGIMYRVFDAYLGGEKRDWSSELHERFTTLVEQAEAQRQELEDARVAGTRPSLDLEGYEGRFTHPMYGEVVVRGEGEGLVLGRGANFVGNLEHWHYDTFQVDWRDHTMGETFATFAIDARGRVSEVSLQGLADFQRAPEPTAAPDPAG